MLCTVPDPGAVLAEIARVLRPRGRYLFLEHIRAHDGERRASWQDRLERPWSLFAGGCHPNRDTAALLYSSPLTVERLDQIEMPRMAGPLVRPAILGCAIRPQNADHDQRAARRRASPAREKGATRALHASNRMTVPGEAIRRAGR